MPGHMLQTRGAAFPLQANWKLKAGQENAKFILTAETPKTQSYLNHILPLGMFFGTVCVVISCTQLFKSLSITTKDFGFRTSVTLTLSILWL